MWDELKWLEQGAIPARDIHRGRHGRNTIYFPSVKNQGQVICESVLEASYCIWLEWDVDVKSYHAQPHTFRWTWNTARFQYTPDFYVIHELAANHFTEVKPDFTRAPAKYRITLREFIDHCDRESIRFKLADAGSIQRAVRLSNLKMLYTLIHRITQWEADYCSAFLSQQDTTLSLREVCLHPTPPSLRALAKAIFSGELLADLDRPLTLDSKLTKRM
ncbi:hypothetical protein AFK24_15475 [Pseudomonas syringae]|uniref:TnsA endonuclease N-terminal domain-containing protein n=1 Tax=Pseudomonas syringae TaxID=317 RepID=A0A1C7Z6S0_PSESX|nr:hypothetical protein [Pseudomonas syringae]OCR24158.1 hypothetical protein AFK24_15475 [Pseudomonas syringae]